MVPLSDMHTYANRAIGSSYFFYLFLTLLVLNSLGTLFFFMVQEPGQFE